VFCLANACAGNPPLVEDDESFALFQPALTDVAEALALQVVRDGEGASKVATLTVAGRGLTRMPNAPDGHHDLSTSKDSRLWVGNRTGDASWRPWPVGAPLTRTRSRCGSGVTCRARGSRATDDLSSAAETMKRPAVEIALDLHLGNGTFTGWFSI